jgi:hypothetical protein
MPAAYVLAHLLYGPYAGLLVDSEDWRALNTDARKKVSVHSIGEVELESLMR